MQKAQVCKKRKKENKPPNKQPRITLKKKSEVGGLTVADYKTYPRATVTKTEVLHTDGMQMNRIASPKTNPCIYDPLTEVPRQSNEEIIFPKFIKLSRIP